jgi:hypothetical protein
METVSDLLRDGDPLRHEPAHPGDERSRVRRAVFDAASAGGDPSPARSRRSLPLLAALVLIAASLAVAAQLWTYGGAAIQAAMRFEVRLAEDHPGPGLREARIARSDRLVYLHEEVVVSNEDIAESTVVEEGNPLRFGVSVQFSPDGARKMRLATAGHVDRPAAILIDGEVVMAPVLTAPIGTSAMISGDYTRDDAVRLADGIRGR